MDALTNHRRIKINRLVHELPYLPQEMIEEILIRLPVKSLGRFRCVSKSWNSLIASRRFIRAHFEKSSTNASLTNRKVITILHSIQEWSLLSLLSEPSARPVDEYVFPTHDDYPSDIVGCCDGLLCILVDEIDFIIWNPSTKKFTLLPSIVDGDLKLVTSGFGYDESTDDYKVFVFMRGDKKGVAKVYSLKTGSWRIVDINIKIDSYISYFGNFFSGKLHWSRCVAKEPKVVEWELSTFDLQNEDFGLVELPDNMDYGSHRPSFVGALDGALCMVCHHGMTQLDVWIKKHYNVRESWYKMATLSHPLGRDFIFMEPLFVGPNGEILFADGFSYNFYVYHPRDARFSQPQLIDKEEFLGVHVYVESLVSAVPHVQTPPTADELVKLQIIAKRFP